MNAPRLVNESELSAWLDRNALRLDTENLLADELLLRLMAGGVLGAGIAVKDGGEGGDVVDSVEAIAAVSERSLAAGFVLWAHRTYVEFLLRSPNTPLRDRLLPDLLAGRVAGATGLSNAMKFLAGLEEPQVKARPRADGRADDLVLDGELPWVTNLRMQGFHVAVAVAHEGARGVFVASLAHIDLGLVRSADLNLMALRATNTAAVTISGVEIDTGRIIHPDANAWLPMVRPAFLGLQCGMSIGLARRALYEARGHPGPGRQALAEPIAELAAALAEQERRLKEGLRSGVFQSKPAELFHIRIALAEIVVQAVGLELQSAGGRAYLTWPGAGFGRRWREAAFIPVITPSLVQLKTVLAAQCQSAA
jgi:alkylation response protein AidB-like acyl-CoA dehydrogenase